MDIEKNIKNNIKKLKGHYLKKIIFQGIGLTSAIAGLVLCLLWYDWKLLVIIIIL